MAIGYRKIQRLGEWGISGTGADGVTPPEIGATVQVTRRSDGTVHEETVAEIEWAGISQRSGERAWVATMRRTASAPASKPPPPAPVTPPAAPSEPTHPTPPESAWIDDTPF